MFVDYQSLVVRDYEEKKSSNTISPRLIIATPAELRNECIAVCQTRFAPKDQRILRNFFGDIGSDVETCTRVIRRCDPGKFKPLQKYLKKESQETHFRNIDLLAWLIDFEPRPFEYGRKYDDLLDDKVRTEKKEGKPANNPNPESQPQADRGVKPITGFAAASTNTGTKGSKGIFRRPVIAILTLLGISLAGYFIWSNKKSTFSAGKEMCMYWTGDHYEPVSCSQKMDNTLVIALDSQKLRQFKRITRPDTITLKSIGKVWYVKINGEIEYYTADGFHPVDIRLRLKPITDYMINKYIYGSAAK